MRKKAVSCLSHISHPHIWPSLVPVPVLVGAQMENEVFELNTVTVLNRQSSMELMALMRKTHVLVEMDARLKWEEREQGWRQLRHDRALREFHAKVSSKAFTNPPARVKLLDTYKNKQVRCIVLCPPPGQHRRLRDFGSSAYCACALTFHTFGACTEWEP